VAHIRAAAERVQRPMAWVVAPAALMRSDGAISISSPRFPAEIETVGQRRADASTTVRCCLR
jgi:hypothetical protein